MPLEDLIISAQHLTDSVKATKRVPAPTLPVSAIQQEEGAEEEVNAVTRRRPAPPNRWNSPGLCHYHRRFGKDAGAPAALFVKPVQKNGRQLRPAGQAAMAARRTGPRTSQSYVCDTISSRMMLVDTGAVRSIFPASREDHKWEPDPAASLTAANGSPILSYGTSPLSISILGQRYSWDFVVGDVRTPLWVRISWRTSGWQLTSARAPPKVRGPSQTWHISPHKNEGPPAHVKFRRLPPQRLQEAKDAFAEMERMGICKKASAVPVVPEDIPKTAIITPFESCVFALSTFGLRNAGATFQRLMDSILRGPKVPQGAPETHPGSPAAPAGEWPRQDAFDKCTFGVQKADFLGHEVSPDGIRPLTSKVAAVWVPVPTSVRPSEFLGMANYYRKFIPGIAHTTAPLTETLIGRPKSLLWGPSQQQAFSPDEGHHRRPPTAFFSKKFNPAEAHYSTFDRELCAVYRAIWHLKFLLEGTPFTIYADHQPLVHAFTKQGDVWSSRQQRHLSAITEFTCSIKYLPGRKNPVADALSRVELNAVQLESTTKTSPGSRLPTQRPQPTAPPSGP
ncbi:uncharacterized protein [Macrobrachium rosenbergii]|uniref:uncharacterized protein n=1 Tax=Macrobrachium rosenbergii TaxID=79674 RepID=UPI0034D64F2C